MYNNIREEELKNKVGADWFKHFDTTEILGNIDFTVFPKKQDILGSEPLLWAEAKTGNFDTPTMFVQLILTIGKARTFDKTLPPAFLGAFDFNKIAFVPYINIQDIFYLNDFNWNVAPSNHDTKEFKLIKNRVEAALKNNTNVFDFLKDKKDLDNFIAILNKWKAKQNSSKPKLVIINTSGGGLRSSNFTTQVIQQLQAQLPNGIMPKTAFITGASGGMLGATYCREIFRRKQKNEFLQGNANDYTNNISKDLLNALTSSLVVRDLIAPAQKFTQSGRSYVKDRAYAFEENLNNNVGGILGGTIGEYYHEEKSAQIPLTIFSSTITRDSRKLMLCSQPLSFAMQPWQADSLQSFVPPDAVDYQGLFKNQNPNDIRILTALRMNATFPYVLPNVWLPTHPVIDVMDAGLRDNYGTDITLRILTYCKKWIVANTSGIVLLQIRDRENSGDWNYPFELDGLNQLITRPMLQLQFNQFKTQQFQQNLQMNEFKQFAGIPLEVIPFQYTPTSVANRASLSFHLTPNEMQDINNATKNNFNTASFARLKEILD